MSMSDSNKLTLHLLEMLINANGALSVAQLMDTLKHRSVTDEMRDLVFNSQDGLNRYLIRYPSLFRVEGDRVTPVIGDGTLLGNSMEPLRRTSSPAISTSQSFIASSPSTPASVSSLTAISTTSGGAIYDFAMESEAVKYFQTQLSKREERWVPIKSISGHLSQASQRVRRAVGPQTEFLNFLHRHPHVFEVQGELVGLKDTFTSSCLLHSSTLSSSASLGGGGFGGGLGSVRRRSERAPHSARFNSLGGGVRPKSMVLDHHQHLSNVQQQVRPSRQIPRQASASSSLVGSPPSSSRSHHSTSATGAPICMTASEYKAIIFLKTCLEEEGGNGLHIASLLHKLGQARETVRNTVGWTVVELQEFLCKHGSFFDITPPPGEIVLARDTRKMNILISGSRPVDQGTHTLTNRKGTIYHVAKLWGIIDLGQHEHVFFDKSILRHVGDLQKYFKHGETLYFNAILAAKDSRAKWRATQVWKESDRGLVELLAGQALSGNGAGGEDTDSGLDQELELEEGLQMTDDIKFLDEELEQEMEEMAAFHRGGGAGDSASVTTTGRGGGDVGVNKRLDDDLLLTNRGFNSVRLYDDTDRATVNGGIPFDDAISSAACAVVPPLAVGCRSGASSPDLSAAHSEPDTMRSIPSLSAEEVPPLSASGGFARSAGGGGGSISSSSASPSSPRSTDGGDNDYRPPVNGHSQRRRHYHQVVVETIPQPSMTSESYGPRTIATQTISTGEIMATQFYHDG